jgi:hypothetical protein
MNQLCAVRSCIFLLTAVAILSGVVFAGPAANPVPLVNAPLVPSAAVPGSAGFTLTVNGTGFVEGAVVNWNGSPRVTTFVSASQVTAAILTSDIAAATTTSVTVVNPGPGAVPSNPGYFSVTVPKTKVPFSATDHLLSQASGRVLVADFNGDGKPDLAILSALGVSCAVLLGNGDGTFQSPKRIPLPKAADDLTAADFNGDGKLDLALTEYNHAGQIEVLLGNGDGSFQAPQNFSTGQGQNGGIIAADLNHDGSLDLVVTNQNSGDISVLLGNGDGTFQGPIFVNTGVSAGSIAVGDFDGDGNLDLAVTIDNASISILLGNGDGTFAQGVSLITGTTSGSIVAGDFNADGKLDLAVIEGFDHPDSDVRVFLGNGDGSFQDGVVYASATDLYGQLAAADVNGDGRIDLILEVGCCGTHESDVAVLLGNGDGSFQAPVFYPVSTGVQFVAAGDFNGDGSTDLVSSNGEDPYALSVLLQTPATFAPGNLSFGTTAVGSSGSPQTTTLTNVGAGPLALTGVSVGGADAGDFSQTNNCPSSLAQGASCAINVTFSPTAVGTRTAVIKVGDSGAPKLADVALKGTGKAAAVSPR